MTASREQMKSELVQQVAEMVRDRLEGQRAEEAESFVHQFFRHTPPEDLVAEAADNLYGAALALWGFAHCREPGEARVRVYNPRPENHGWKSSHTIVEVVNDDMPFLVDSVVAAVQSLAAEVHLVIHPVLRLERDENHEVSRLLGEDESASGARKESFMHLQINELPDEAHAEIRERVLEALADVRAAVEDWKEMRSRCVDLVTMLRESPPRLPAEEIAEGSAFLDWLTQNHFTFLGYREYLFEGEGDDAAARVIPESGLGILRMSETTVFAEVRRLGPMPNEARNFLRRPELLVISKAKRKSTVHRPVHLDAVAVKTIDDSGEVVGQQLFVGLFTSTAYSSSPRDIPLLRRKAAKVVEQSGFEPNSHDGKALLHVLESYPRDELFQITDEDLQRIAMGIVNLQERQRTALFVRPDPFQRFVSCLVYVPRDRYDTNLRLKIRDILTAAYDGELAAFYTHLTDSNLARLHVIVRTRPNDLPRVDEAAIESKLVEASRSWADRLKEALIEGRGEERGVASMRRFAEAFPPSYQERFNEQTAVFDIGCVENCLETGTVTLNLFRPLEAEERELRLKIYVSGPPAPLSDVLPMLENMGLKVIDEIPWAICPMNCEEPVWIREFKMSIEDDSVGDPSEIREAFHEALRQVWHGEMENDGFNRLVLCARMTARDVTVLRAYCKYLLQARIPLSQSYMEETLAGNPAIARLLVDLFMRRFDPVASSDGPAPEEISAEIEKRLEDVAHLDEDRIIRRFRNLIGSTLRTNFYQRAADGGPKPYLSFKLDSKAVRNLPDPRPFREIFVYSPRVEAVHLRGGRVARGGLRWSDRREDFRTEVLGLMKAQMVKNAVIVPVGSKGGFVVKNPPTGGRDELMAEVVECYKTMIRGVLDLTDNLGQSGVEPPADVVRLDDDDPYLVVAADKGTATFSDIANGVSAEYGFWLDDAFASGGSAGYDHKKMAITARGAWESVKRHFREIGKDIQSEDFTVVGVGDMSGDVFGNGMLLSRHIRLLAAFNHLHVFVDPDPDLEASFEERRRLFELPRSSWGDYDSSLISAGGGVFDRAAKSIAITPEMAALFGLEEESVTPSELISAMLKAEVELLWFGGIGTYVKATGETHAEAGDRANDALRVDAQEIRAKVIGEGANLGMTQRARIELGGLGCHLNTDAIDNSAGVDCSDHEVNIKILLREIEAAGDLTRKQRDELLREMTDEVAELVLRDNYLQTQAITVTHRLGARLVDRTARLIRRLEKAKRLDRKIEFLPDNETLAERMQQGIGFTRSEIAVLLAYAKMELYDELLASDLPDAGYLETALRNYFPTALRERYPRQISRHRLRREIIATMVTNDIVNRVGITFLHEVKERTGMDAASIARAYLIGREIFGMSGIWERIEALDNQVPASVQAAMLAECGRLLERVTVWFLREEEHPLEVSEQVDRYCAGVRRVAAGLDSLLFDSAPLAERAAHLRDEGVPEEMAELAASLPLLAPTCDIVRIGRRLEVPVDNVAEIYFAVGSRFGFDWLRRAAGQLPTDTAWDKLAVTAIIDDLFGHQSELTHRIIKAAGGEEVDARAIQRWSESRRSQVTRTEQLLAELQSVAAPNLAMLAVANRQLRSMSG